jgi:hypothetical protein
VAKNNNNTAVLRGHVSNSSSISKVKVLHASAIKFDELPNDSSLSEHLDDGEYAVSSGDVVLELASELETDHLGQDHGNGFSEHDSLSFDSADTPSGHSEPIDHGGVGVGTDTRVGVQHLLFVLHDHSGQVLKVDLMDDTWVK